MARRPYGKAARQPVSSNWKVRGFPAAGEGFQRAGGFGEHFLGTVEGDDGRVGEPFQDRSREPARARRELDDLERVVELGRYQIEECVPQLIAPWGVDTPPVDEDFRVVLVPEGFGHDGHVPNRRSGPNRSREVTRLNTPREIRRRRRSAS